MVTVLLVDDDPMTLAALRRLMLSEGGYRVEVALNAEQALADAVTASGARGGSRPTRRPRRSR